MQQVAQAVQQLRADLQQQLPSGKLKAIESKLAALEGSVLSAGDVQAIPLPIYPPTASILLLGYHFAMCPLDGMSGGSNVCETEWCQRRAQRTERRQVAGCGQRTDG